MPGRKRLPAERNGLAVRVGVAIRKRREAAELTQEALAELASLSKNYIGSLERGEYEVGLGVFVQVARALGAHGSEILAELGE